MGSIKKNKKKNKEQEHIQKREAAGREDGKEADSENGEQGRPGPPDGGGDRAHGQLAP